ncbi:hypothetical protein [Andreprevotia chitinilytica]|nr:hypothetical protein [Andreprevotia chitinilytica]
MNFAMLISDFAVLKTHAAVVIPFPNAHAGASLVRRVRTWFAGHSA